MADQINNEPQESDVEPGYGTDRQFNSALLPQPSYADIGRDFVNSGIYQKDVVDRTGDLVEKVHEVLGRHHTAKAVAVFEPGTGVEAIALLKPDGSVMPLHDSFFDDYRKFPKRYTGTASVTRIESFIGHVNRFKDVQSALFAIDDMKNPCLTAVLNYNQHREDGAIFGPRFGDHRTRFEFPLSEEWKLWVARNKTAMTLGEFSEFIEDRFIDVELIGDVSELNDDIQKLVAAVGQGGIATPSKLIELSRGLKVHVKDEVTDSRNIASGEIEIQFKSEHTDKYGNKLSIPSLFVLNIPVFAKGHIWRVAARLRYRVSDGQMKFWYELWGLDRVFEQAFSEVCASAQTETGLPLFFGKPE